MMKKKKLGGVSAVRNIGRLFQGSAFVVKSGLLRAACQSNVWSWMRNMVRHSICAKNVSSDGTLRGLRGMVSETGTRLPHHGVTMLTMIVARSNDAKSLSLF